MISVQARQVLLKKQAELEERLNHQHTELSVEIGKANELINDEFVDQRTLKTLQELRRVKIALHKIGKPGLGSCVNCGQIIGKQRLNASTQIDTCICCAKHNVH